MKPQLITSQSLADEVHIRWRNQYKNYRGGGYGRDKGEILRELEALPLPRDVQKVNEIIGNKSWTEVPACDACERRNPPFVVIVGQEPDYESPTAYLCGACVAEAAALALIGGAP